MNKKEILDQILKSLNATLSTLIAAALDAKDAATNEESKAENKYDTRGLEASYLAGAQALRAEELKQSIGQLEKLELREYLDQSKPGMTALIHVEVDELKQKYLFLLPTAGGTKLSYMGNEIQVVTPESPIGQRLLNSEVGEDFEFKAAKATIYYEILGLL